jgi:integrase
MRVKLTDRFVAGAKVTTRTDYFDEVATGLALRVSETGAKNWTFNYTLDGKRVRLTLGAYPAVSLASARSKAVSARTELAAGHDPRQSLSNGDTFHSVCEDYLAREGHRLRTADRRKATLERLVYPRLGARPIADIRRSEIVRLLDEIEDQNGPVMADRTLEIVRKVMNWYATRNDEFRPPIIKGMARTKSKDRARKRVLTDDELRKVWRAAEGGQLIPTMPVFGRLVRFILLTATRLSEAARMHRSELKGTEWVIAAERYKNKIDHLIPLSGAAMALLPAEGEWMFSTSGLVPISGFSDHKRRFDDASGVRDWRLHDLRRTARTLMSRAGVIADHAERCLGHVVPGIRGVYDHHEFVEEKRLAFEALAGQIERIVNPRENVVALRGAQGE